jgi:hypothetical protein
MKRYKNYREMPARQGCETGVILPADLGVTSVNMAFHESNFVNLHLKEKYPALEKQAGKTGE